MAETPNASSPDTPPASRVAEENKPSTHRLVIDGDRLKKEAIPPAPTTHHSPAPWSLYPSREESPCSTTGACFELRAANGTIVAYIAYDEEQGIDALEWADAHLILASPRMLHLLEELFGAYQFARSLAGLEQAKGAEDLARQVRDLLTELEKAGVL